LACYGAPGGMGGGGSGVCLWLNYLWDSGYFVYRLKDLTEYVILAAGSRNFKKI